MVSPTDNGNCYNNQDYSAVEAAILKKEKKIYSGISYFDLTASSIIGCFFLVTSVSYLFSPKPENSVGTDLADTTFSVAAAGGVIASIGILAGAAFGCAKKRSLSVLSPKED